MKSTMMVVIGLCRVGSIRAFLMIFLFSVPSWACSPPYLGFYEPTPTILRDMSRDIPPPILTDFELTRGTQSVGFSCDDAGILSMKVSLPAGSGENIEHYGVSFKVVEGADPHGIFTEEPIALWDEEGTGTSGYISFFWLDGPPKEHMPLSMVVEAKFVYGTREGPRVRFRIK